MSGEELVGYAILCGLWGFYQVVATERITPKDTGHLGCWLFNSAIAALGVFGLWLTGLIQ